MSLIILGVYGFLLGLSWVGWRDVGARRRRGRRESCERASAEIRALRSVYGNDAPYWKRTSPDDLAEIERRIYGNNLVYSATPRTLRHRP